MTPAVLDRPTCAPAVRGTSPRPGGNHGGPTLEGAITRAWEGLAAHRGVGCPVCGGQMAPRYGAAGAAPVGGRCHDCGSTLG
jgi:hypothetical protein